MFSLCGLKHVFFNLTQTESRQTSFDGKEKKAVDKQRKQVWTGVAEDQESCGMFSFCLEFWRESGLCRMSWTNIQEFCVNSEVSLVLSHRNCSVSILGILQNHPVILPLYPDRRLDCSQMIHNSENQLRVHTVNHRETVLTMDRRYKEVLRFCSRGRNKFNHSRYFYIIKTHRYTKTCL